MRRERCHFVQGHLFGDPMSADDFERLLSDQRDGRNEHIALFA